MAAMPTIVSFYGGDQYYHDAAKELIADCRRMGLPYDIRHVEKGEGEDWADMCRKKIQFYLETHRRARNGIFWIDVDSKMLRRPDFLAGSRADMGAFLRAFAYARDFDPLKAQRFFSPSFLYFGATPLAREFLEFAAETERNQTDTKGTDDYFLQEAWKNFPKQLRLDIWPPNYLMINDAGDPKLAFFNFQSSGNVPEFRKKVAQHGSGLMDADRKKAVIKSLLAEAEARGDKVYVKKLQREVWRLDKTDQRAAVSVAMSKSGPNRVAEVRSILWKASKPHKADQFAKRTWASLELNEGDLTRAKALCEQLLVSKSLLDREFAKSRLYRVALEERGAAFEKEKRPKLWWMETPYPGNFGDVINPYIVERLSGVPPVFTPAAEAILMIGSIIKFAKEGSIVWGAGTPRMSDQLSPSADYRSVRGPLTRELVLQSGGQCAPVYGDCAWFLPHIYRPPESTPHYKLGLIRHVNHVKEEIELDGVREISIARIGDSEFEAFIDEIHDCEKVLSTSLHGLIVCHAYGIPAEWCVIAGLENKISAGDRTKFDDYFLSIGVEPHDPIVLDPAQTITSSLADGVKTVAKTQLDVQAMAEVAPIEVKLTLRAPNLVAI